MGLFHCVQSGCAEVRYKPYKLVQPDSKIRYRYPNEDWITVKGDDYSINNNAAGQCEGSYYRVEGKTQEYFNNGGPFSYVSRLTVVTPPVKKIINPSNPWKFADPLSNNPELFTRAYISIVDLSNNILEVSTYSAGSTGWKNDAVSNIEIQKVFANGRPDNRGDNCGECLLEIFSNGVLIVSESRSVCPEVELLNESENEDNFQCRKSDRTQVIRIEKLPFLERVNESSANAILTTHQPIVNFGIEDLGENQYGIGLIYDGIGYGAILDLSTFASEDTIIEDIDFNVEISKILDLYKFAVTINGVTKQDYITINSQTLNVNRGSFGGSGNGDDDMACEGLAEAMQLNLAEILAAIAAVQAQVTQVKEVVTVEVEAYALSEFDCPEEDGGDEAENNAAQVKDYKLATLPALHQQLQYMNQNQLSMFERICLCGGVLAMPDWWQVRIGSNIPQIVCSFRKGGSSTYHSLSIPHPANTDKPTKQLLPAYIKGSWQGIITCKDNSKFIINCETKAEVERMCGIAAQLIHSDFLELPPRIYVGERKGQAVSVDPMLPAVIQYFEFGQQNTIPNWRVRVTDLE